MDRIVDEDERILKFNYGTKKGHCVDYALIEKRLIFDCAKRVWGENVHANSNLEAWCYRQLFNVGEMIDK